MTLIPPACSRILCASLLLVGWSGWRSAPVQASPLVTASHSNQATNQSDSSQQPDPAVSIPLDRPEVSPDLPEGTQLIIRAVESANPQTEIELATALNTMLDIRQFDQARYYLSRLQALPLDDAKRFQIYEALGSNFFLELHATDELQPVGREFAKQILTAARSQATSPQRIEALIKRLSDQDISARSEAFRQFRRLGPAAVAELIHVFTDPQRRVEFPYLRSALKSLGEDALPPLLGAARATHLQVQAEAIRALGHYRSAEATDAMMRTYLSPKLPESIRRVALDSLMNSERLPADPGYVEDRFYQRSQDYLLGRRKILGGISDTVTLWQWDPESERLNPNVVSTPTATRIAAAERAADLFEIRPDAPRNRAIYLLTQLEAAKRIAGSNKKVDVEGLMQQFPDVEAHEIETVLTEALKLDLVPAATACCELLGNIGAAEFLYGNHQHTHPLVQAMQLGDRHLQFAALEAIGHLDPQQPYPGSSYVLLMAVYMASSEGRGAGLVGHVRPDLAQTYAPTLETAGLFGIAVTNSRDFFRAATTNPDLEVLLVTDTLDKPDYAELIQQLRKDLRTKRIPIGLLVRDQEHGIRVERMMMNDPFFETMPLSLDSEHVAAHVRRLRGLTDPWLVTDLDRRRHSASAMNWLNLISNDREKYRFYDLSSHQEALAKLLYLPGFSETGSQILVHLGTPAAQRELLNFAGQSSLPIAERKRAVEAFAEAIKNGGTLLTREEILQQYERYNASEFEPKETQQVLGAILDALESHGRSEN